MTSSPLISPAVADAPPATVPSLPTAAPGRLWSRALLVLFVLVLFVPPFWLSGNEYRLNLFAKYAALALFALSVDLIWGYTGLMSLGQGLYFGIGAYAVGFSLILQEAARVADVPAVYGPEMARPEYMVQCRMPGVPYWIGQLIDIRLAIVVAVVLPMLVAALFGYVVFRRRIKGVYFSLITQALVLASFILVSNQRPYTGGVDGLTSLADLKLFDYEFKNYYTLYFLIAGVLAVCFLACMVLVSSKFGRVLTAIRDNENRVLALGYNTAMYKTFVFALAGGMAGLAGALFTAANNSAGPQFFSISDSIEVVILVAVGGRGTLVGPIVGAFLVSVTKDYANQHYRALWPIILGGLFVGVVVFLPEGIMGGLRRLKSLIGQSRFLRRSAA